MRKFLAVILLASSSAWGACSVEGIFNALRPGASYIVHAGDYDGVEWTDPVQAKPSLEEFNLSLAACIQATIPTPEQQRQEALVLFSSTAGQQKLIRAILLVLLDENNVTRQWITSFKVAVAAATSLADLKARVAALPNMPDRTVLQAKNAVQDKLNSGSSD